MGHVMRSRAAFGSCSLETAPALLAAVWATATCQPVARTRATRRSAAPLQGSDRRQRVSVALKVLDHGGLSSQRELGASRDHPRENLSRVLCVRHWLGTVAAAEAFFTRHGDSCGSREVLEPCWSACLCAHVTTVR